MPNLPAWRATPNDTLGRSYPAQESKPTTPAYSPLNVKAGTGDARNWWRRLFNISNPAGNRTAVLHTEISLQTGPAPTRIRRIFSDLSGGSIDGRGSRAWPTTGGESYIPHLSIIKVNPAGKATVGMRTSDDNAVIPALYTGGPM